MQPRLNALHRLAPSQSLNALRPARVFISFLLYRLTAHLPDS